MFRLQQKIVSRLEKAWTKIHVKGWKYAGQIPLSNSWLSALETILKSTLLETIHVLKSTCKELVSIHWFLVAFL